MADYQWYIDLYQQFAMPELLLVISQWSVVNTVARKDNLWTSRITNACRKNHYIAHVTTITSLYKSCVSSGNHQKQRSLGAKSAKHLYKSSKKISVTICDNHIELQMYFFL